MKEIYKTIHTIKRKFISYIFMMIMATFIISCENYDSEFLGIPVPNPWFDPEPEDSRGGPATNALFVVTTDYSTGAFAVIDLNSLVSYKYELGVIHQDAEARVFNGLVYVVNRLGRDNIQILNPKNKYKTIREISMKSLADTGNCNPHDIVVVEPDRAYVSRYGEKTMWIINPQSGKKTGEIDLSGYAAPDAHGLPRMSTMYYHKEAKRLFVTAQRLKEDWHISNYSSILVIDVDKNSAKYNQVIKEIKLQEVSWGMNATDPYTNLRFVPASMWDPKGATPAEKTHDHLFVSCTGNFGFFFELDCGIVAIDVQEMKMAKGYDKKGYVLCETTAETELTEFVIKSKTEGYATTSDSKFKSKLLKFNPSTGEVIKTIRSDDGEFGYLWTLAIDRTSGRLFVCDRNNLDPGVRVYDTNKNDKELNGGMPINVGLPPFDLQFIK